MLLLNGYGPISFAYQDFLLTTLYDSILTSFSSELDSDLRQSIVEIIVNVLMQHPDTLDSIAELNAFGWAENEGSNRERINYEELVVKLTKSKDSKVETVRLTLLHTVILINFPSLQCTFF